MYLVLYLLAKFLTTNRRQPTIFFGTLSLGLCAKWPVSRAYCLFFIRLAPKKVLFFLNLTVCPFVKKFLSETIQID